jgi:hypothetical protein
MAALYFATLASNTEKEATFVKDSLSPTLNDIDHILTESLKD